MSNIILFLVTLIVQLALYTAAIVTLVVELFNRLLDRDRL